jgi:type IV pilus assembly protein PilN
MRLDINLATHPYEDERRFWLRWGTALAGLLALTLVLVATTALFWYSASRDRSVIRQTEEKIAERDQEQQAAVALLNQPENATVRDRALFLNGLFQRKSLSWTKVLENLEQVMPPRLHVVSIHPQVTPDKELQLKLVVAGESRERAIELVRNMENSRRFQQTQIEQETTVTAQAPGDNVQFDISTLYVPGPENPPGGAR